MMTTAITTEPASSWSDYNNAPVVSFPNMVSSSDLFDGELFGDELMDIYNSAVEATANNPDLASFLDGTDDKKDDADAMLDAADNDGFGTFRPNTSFNDLTTILNAEGEVIDKSHQPPKPNNNEAMAVDIDASSSSSSSLVKDNTKKSATPKKRSSAIGGSGSPAAKRKVAANRRSNTKQQQPPPPESVVVPEAAPSNAALIPQPVTSEGCVAAPPAATVTAPPPTTNTAVVAAAANVAAAAAAAVYDPMPDAATTSAESDLEMSTEPADFQALAEAAVSSLIQSVTAGGGDKSKDKVDVSTPHIKALTGNNWVVACAATTATQGIGGPSTVSTTAATTVAAAAAAAAANDPNRVRRQNLTPDERVRQNRDRNREHARNTRLRKKAYVEELKKTLTELVAQRDASEQEKRQSAQREVEQREVRFRVMEEFLKLRGRNEPNANRWAAILEDGFTLTLPSTDFRKMAMAAAGEMTLGEERTLTGVAEVMGDSESFSTFLQSIGGGSMADAATVVTCQYGCDRKNFFMDGCQTVMEWEASSVGAVSNGAKTEVTFRGVVRGKYSPASNKLISAHITCDVGVLLLKLQNVAPNQRSKATSHERAAAQAAEQADALIDSIQIPLSVPSAVLVHSSSSSSEASVGDESR